MAVATTSRVAATISIPRTSRIGRAEIFSPCPNPGNGPSGAARNLGKDCVLLPMEIVRKTLLFTPKNGFIAFLSDLFGEETAKSLVEKYRIGTTKDGYAVFYQFDIRDRCRAGKIIPYNPRTGHRIKDGSVPAAMWVHSRLKALHQLPEDWTLSQCLFGEHLLPLCPDLPVALVEAEKTAVICSAVFPEFLWLATGGLGQFNDRVKVLLGRQVIAFPDLGACDRWRKKAKDYPLLDITVSDFLEKNATPQQREMGADLADWVVEERMAEGGFLPHNFL